MVSIIMSTYNGTTYLEEQLDSIRLQTRQADEVVISDDCSKDQTVEAVKAYIQKYDLKNWSIYRNETNCGWEKNFMQGIEKTRGDLLFFADQDDIWEAEKLENVCSHGTAPGDLGSGFGLYAILYGRCGGQGKK